MKSIKNEIRVALFFLKETFKFSKSYVLLSLLSSLLQSFQPLINVMTPRYLLNEMTGLNRTGYLALYLGIIIVSNLVIFASTSVLTRYISVGSTRVQNHFLTVCGDKLMNIPFEKAENPSFIELKERAMYPVTERGCIQDLVNLIPRLIVQLIIIAGTLSVILTFDSIILLLIVLVVVVNLIVAAFFQRLAIASQKRTVSSNRQYSYYISRIDDADFELEARIHRCKDFTLKKAARAYKLIMDSFATHYEQTQIPVLIRQLTGIAQNFAVYLYIAWRAIESALPLGDFAMYISAAAVFGAALFESFAVLLRLREACRYLDDFTTLLRLETQNDAGALIADGSGDIEFVNVSFKYAGCDDWVLRNINLKIGLNESISVVGKNGAGKSTLIKLLTRLYNPTEGQILLNGTDIKEYSFESYRKLISVIFQDFSLMNYSIAENIYCDSPVDRELAAESLERAAILDYLKTLPQGIDTPIGKWYDESGTDFSGGQKQKIAIARALYRNAPIMILDEPTAALDPIAEAEVYEKFNDVIKGKTAVYISHRLSSCKFASRILLIEGGTVKEEGSHDALIKLGGSYAEMYGLQASFAKKEVGRA